MWDRSVLIRGARESDVGKSYVIKIIFYHNLNLRLRSVCAIYIYVVVCLGKLSRVLMKPFLEFLITADVQTRLKMTYLSFHLAFLLNAQTYLQPLSPFTSKRDPHSTLVWVLEPLSFLTLLCFSFLYMRLSSFCYVINIFVIQCIVYHNRILVLIAFNHIIMQPIYPGKITESNGLLSSCFECL